MKELFYKPLKIKAKDKDILIWGCLHYNHECKGWDNPLWKLRGYDSVESHNKAIIDNWNAKANKNTIGFLLGDTMFGKGGKEKFLEIFEQLIFDTIYICSGNHSAGWHQAFSSVEGNELKLNDKKIIFVPNYIESFINGQSVVMSHYPLFSWNGQGEGSWHFYSHVHNSLEKSEIGRAYKAVGWKSYEVSVELNKYPINFSEARKFMNSQNGGSPDHHDTNTQNPF